MGVHSTFFGPIKYAILPQHLRHDEVLGGTASSKPAPTSRSSAERSSPACSLASRRSLPRRPSAFALLGFLAGRQVPPAPPAAERLPFNWHIVHASIELVSATHAHPPAVPRDPRDQLLLDDRRGADHHLPAAGEECARRDEQVASLFIAIFSIGIAIGSVAINRLLKSEVSARFAPASVIAHGRVRPAASTSSR